jgi:poly(3-hydroxybutyrate) depolymerase
MIYVTSIRVIAISTLSIALGACAAKPVSTPLPKLNFDQARTMVSGISSGAYMATQMHVAFSDHIHGAALVAGGPYHCADGKLDVALAHCMNLQADAAADLAPMLATTRQRAEHGEIAPLASLSGDRVYVLHGREDTTVAESVSRLSAEFYRQILPNSAINVSVDDGHDFAHTWPTETAGSDCHKSESPYLGHCGFDAAGAIFHQLYGEPTTPVGIAGGELRSFAQALYRNAEKNDFLADTGYVYVPKDCAAGARCSLHIAFHGCLQNAESVGQSFVKDAGYNRWADAYHVVVLYPQTHATYAPLNPKACWDWWGYSGADYDARSGAQMQLIARVAVALGAALQ